RAAAPREEQRSCAASAASAWRSAMAICSSLNRLFLTGASPPRPRGFRSAPKIAQNVGPLGSGYGVRGKTRTLFFETLRETQQRLDAARAELERAQDLARSRQVTWDRLSALLDATRNLADAWDQAGLEERRTLLDWWVLDVMIAVEPIEGMRRANR